MTARARRTSSFLGLALALLLVPLWLSTRGRTGAAAGADPADSSSGMVGTDTDPGKGESGTSFVVPEDFPVTLIRSGLDADALAAAGVASNSILGVLQDVADAVNQAPSALAQADASYASLRVETGRLQRLIQSGKGSQEDIATYQTQKAAFEAAKGARQSILDGYFAAGIADLSNPQRAALTQIRANRSWKLPLEFLVVERSQAEWVALRDALANERIAPKLDVEADQTLQASLATWRANQTVAAARTSLTSNTDAVRSAWSTAAGE